ncbi:ATP-dependent helicase, putative [Candida dubliniensis CD36]|uniref:ATP-dependent helicase, putative n=1 Tax=Candida dubliniensis (strain CD36 / ATCC MYA-646 / CBS 7987 / NCPF 3949 / NRRL Y-17841) TaxID=573826 RepID=B9WFC0_CANDC|nr:ATP-dependent helicase, putative [Candida dubliniensis CD36]CAX41939.1 ATP-dependent helicase, putative [Candida dubliniensis CD36]
MFKKLKELENIQYSNNGTPSKQDLQPVPPASFVTGNDIDVKQATGQHEYKTPLSTISRMNPAPGNTLPSQPYLSQQPPIKKQRLESLHTRNTSPFSFNHGIANNNNSNHQFLADQNNKPPESIEIISLSDSDDDKNPGNQSDNEDIEVLDEQQAANISWKDTSFDQSNPISSVNTSQQQQVVEKFKPEPVLPGSFVPRDQGKQVPGNDKDGDGDDDLEILSSRSLQVNNPTNIGLYNVPAPVPQVGSMQADAIFKEELENRARFRSNDLVNLQKQKDAISRELVVSQVSIDNFKKNIATLGRALSQAVSLGRHGDVQKLRQAIQTQTELSKAPKMKLNKNQDILMKIETMISSTKRELEAVYRQVRNIGHLANSSFNPYEAQIVAETQRVKVDESEIKDLLDNIRPDEDLEEGLEPTPPELKVNLLKHQRMGLTWMKRMEASKAKGGILADDMGLGKTIQTLALMMASKGSNLIVAPVSLLRQWMAEIESKTKSDVFLSVGIYHGKDKKKMKGFELMKEYDIVMVSYTTLVQEWKKHFSEDLKEHSCERSYFPDPSRGGKSYMSPFFSRQSQFQRIILDEAQAIKNKQAIASKAVTYLKAKYRFCLTGTPMQNGIEELYPLLRFLKIQPYCAEEKFRTDILTPIKSKTDLYDEYDVKESMKKIQAVLKSILLRRTKDSLIDGAPILNLPEKHVLSDYVSLENEELAYYQSIESRVQKAAKKILGEHTKNAPALTLLLRLRQACCHSYLVEIGEYKAKVKDSEADASFSNFKLDWRSMVNNARDLKESAKQQVHSLIDALNGRGFDENTLACPVCFDNIDIESSLLIFGECGHVICKGCCNTFFENCNVGEEDDESPYRIGECKDCQKTVKEHNITEYLIFDMLHIQKLDMSQVHKFCSQHYQHKIKSNQALIREFIKRDNGFESSAKIHKCVEMILDLFSKNPGEKVIVFSQFTSLFDLMALVLQNQHIEFLRYDGTMSMDVKNNVIKEFYQSNKNVLLLSLRAGNAGLTLTCANHVIIMDPFWNPFVEEQAMGRAHRIGQTREVFVHRVLIAGTVENRIMELQESKKHLINSALDEHGMKSISQLNRRELGFLFGLNSLTG